MGIFRIGRRVSLDRFGVRSHKNDARVTEVDSYVTVDAGAVVAPSEFWVDTPSLHVPCADDHGITGPNLGALRRKRPYDVLGRNLILTLQYVDPFVRGDVDEYPAAYKGSY